MLKNNKRRKKNLKKKIKKSKNNAKNLRKKNRICRKKLILLKKSTKQPFKINSGIIRLYFLGNLVCTIRTDFCKQLKNYKKKIRKIKKSRKKANERRAMTKEKLPLLKDTTKQFLNLPGEIKLDILKFLKFNQLLSLQQTNYYFYCLIRQNEGILACRRLYAVKPIMDNSKDLSEQDFFKIESGIFNILLNDQLVERWQSAVDSRIPVYLSLCDTPPNNKLYTRVDMSEVEDHYMLKLPVYPKTTEEMKIVRCWLEKLFLCTFECAEFTDYFFNPEMIKILFENEENIPTQFRSERVEIVYCNVNIKNALRFTLDHLIINQLRIFFASFDKKEKCNKYLLDLLNNGGKNIISIWISLETRKLINLILMHIMTQDCSNFVSCIIIDFFSAPEINSDQNTEKSFTITNTYNSNVIFDLDWNGDKLVIFKKEEESSF